MITEKEWYRMSREMRMEIQSEEIKFYKLYDWQKITKEELSEIVNLRSFEGISWKGFENYYRIDLKTIWITVLL